MQHLSRPERALAAALAALAGFVDVTGYIHLGGYFVSFMSGNTTRAAAGLARSPHEALIAGGLIGAFVAGVITGSLAGHFADGRRRPVVLAIVAALLAMAAVSDMRGQPWAAGAAMAFAMGAMNAVFEQAGDVRFGLTYMTGTLVKVGQRLAAALRGASGYAWAPFLLQWMALAGGAILGAIAQPALGFAAIWIAVAMCALLALTLAVGKGTDQPGLG